MTIYEELTEYLAREPKARERKNKDRAIVNLLLKGHHGIRKAVEDGYITKDALTWFVQSHNSYDRGWRKVTAENMDLRGSDYDEKGELEIKKQQELGYNV